MKREEILAVLTDHAKLWEGRGNSGYADDLIAIREVIASAMDDATAFFTLSVFALALGVAAKHESNPTHFTTDRLVAVSATRD